MKKVLYLSSLMAFCFTLCSVVATALPITLVHITMSPRDTTVCSGTHPIFTAAAIDTTGGITTTVSYLWQVSTDGGTTWSYASDTTIYSGDSTATLTVSANVLMNGYKYRCRASDSNGTSYTSSAILTDIGIAPGTISGPSIVCKTSSITLFDSVTGGKWHSNNTAIATIGSGTGVVTGLLPGYDTVTYTDTNICGMGVTSAVIRVDTVVTAKPISGPSATCVAHYITLTNPNVLGTWSWSTSNGRATITHAGLLSGVSHGLDTAFYVFTNACNTVTSSFVVTVDTVLNAGTISGATNLCAGSWTHLTESVSGGTWFSSSSAIAVVDGSGNVTGVGQGAVTISYYLSNACGASTATHSMLLSRSASNITGSDSVGVGLSKTLADTVLGGTWTTNDTSIATIIDTSGIVTGVAVGTTTITYTVTNFCGTSYAVMTLNVGNHPDPGTITGPTSVCLGTTITLSSSVSGGTWSSSSDTNATVSSGGVVSGLTVDSGTAMTPVTISYTVHTGFGDSTTTVIVNVLHTPIISITGPPAFALGQNYQIRAVPPDGTWSHTNNTIGTFLLVYDSSAFSIPYATFLSYIMTGQGTDVLHYHATNACGSADSSLTATIHGVKVNTVNSAVSALNIYPNPTQGEFSINVSTNTNEQAVVTITNMVGEKVSELTIPTNKLVDVKLDQPAGIYLISATTVSGNNYTAKISVAK